MWWMAIGIGVFCGAAAVAITVACCASAARADAVLQEEARRRQAWCNTGARR
jgi:hypothetical protein